MELDLGRHGRLLAYPTPRCQNARRDRQCAGRGSPVPSPGLDPWSQIHLVGPGAALLAVQLPVGLGDALRVQDAAAVLECGPLREVGADELGVDGTIDHY